MILRLLWPKILIAVITCVMVGYIGSLPTTEALSSWYPGILKPSFNPPNWIFAPVWTTLYVMMGVAIGIIWHAGWEREVVKNAVMLFLAQLVLNGFWSVIFFGARSPGGALVIIIILWILIILCIKRFFPINRFAAYLMVPYLLWVSFALALNVSIYWLNK
ncbi:MAG: tryptophan-rich sensory protein [Saprospiraceae bacterium]|nr:tryptophan-rich sensory protein [Saprospiraceae bacterium]